MRKDLSKQPSLLFLGRDSYLKGFNTFLNASYELLKRNYSVKFQLTQNFKSARNKAIIEMLNKQFKGAYRLLGHLRYEDVLRLHSASHALLFPSVWEEPLPYAVVESMCAGTILIASRVGGVPEIVEGSFAEKMLFEPYNVDECIDRLESLLAISNEQVVDIGFNLRNVALKKFNSEDTGKKLTEVFSC